MEDPEVEWCSWSRRLTASRGVRALIGAEELSVNRFPSQCRETFDDYKEGRKEERWWLVVSERNDREQASRADPGLRKKQTMLQCDYA